VCCGCELMKPKMLRQMEKYLHSSTRTNILGFNAKESRICMFVLGSTEAAFAFIDCCFLLLGS